MAAATTNAQMHGATPADDAAWRVVGDHPDVLAGAVLGMTDLALWRPAARLGLDRWLDALRPEQLPEAHDVVTPEAARAMVLAACREAGHAAEGPAGRLAAEIGGLAQRFGRLGGLDAVDLRLKPIDHDACRRFHRDRVALRLIATLRGPGTEIVPPAHAEEALRLQEDYRGPREHLERGTVALFRGSVEADTGVVHRSPPVAGLGITRLLLCLSVPFRT